MYAALCMRCGEIGCMPRDLGRVGKDEEDGDDVAPKIYTGCFPIDVLSRLCRTPSRFFRLCVALYIRCGFSDLNLLYVLQSCER